MPVGTPAGGAVSGEKKLPVSSAAAHPAQRSFPYDLGALKALFHHARISYKDNRSPVRIRSRSDRSLCDEVASRHKADATTSEPRGYGATERVSRAKSCGEGERSTGGARSGPVAARSSRIGGHDGETVSDPADRLARVYTPTDSARILDGVVGCVSKLEKENLFPSDFNNSLEAQGVNRQESWKLPLMSQARVEGQAMPLPPAAGAGGAFARLVVVKELQLVPEYAPFDIRHLLERALNHHQVRGWNGSAHLFCLQIH